MTKDFITVVAAVIDQGGRLLVCQRPSEKKYGGLWEFPGGKCETGESIRSAAHRELLEELNVSVTIVGDVEFSVRDYEYGVEISFVPVQIDGEPSCREHKQLRWASLPEIALLPLAPSDRQFVNMRLSAQRPE